MIAICFVVHNQLQYTKWFIESIARNSYPHPLGFFVLDNGSSDGSLEWLRSMKVSPVVILRNEGNESLSKGWSRVLQLGLDYGAELLCLANNDLVVGPGWLDAIVEQSKKDLKAYWLPNAELTPERMAEARTRPRTGGTRPARAGWCLFFRDETVREFLPLPEELRLWYGDDMIHWKLKKAGYRCLSVDDSYVYHYGSKTISTIGPIQAIIDADKEAYFRLTGEKL